MSLIRRNGSFIPHADGLGVTVLHPASSLHPHRAGRRGRGRVASAAVAAAVVGGSILAAGVAPAGATVQSSQVRTALSVTTAQAPLAATPTSEQTLVKLINTDRVHRGLKAYAVSSALSQVAEAQARRMATQRRLYHNPNLATEVHAWRALGENVAYTSSVTRAHSLLMGSAPHRANLLSRTFTQVGVGVVKDSSGTVWVVEVFRKPA